MSAPHVMSVVTYLPTAEHTRATVGDRVAPRVHGGKVVRSASKKVVRRTAVPWTVYGTTALVAVNVLFFGWYLVGVNNFAGLGYDISQARKQLMKSTEAQRQLQVAMAERSAAVRIREQALAEQQYVAQGIPEFVPFTTAPTQVSMR
ncbi:MAG: hypothetical protein JNK33_02195 [Candidatus Doudnabacteria bacterium]|nr:hypothetical protein [Candidatus Doudnabacteria bacterium]